jgi:hypothetical protein
VTLNQVRSGLYLVFFVAMAMLVDGRPPGAVFVADVACSTALVIAMAVYVWWLRRRYRR